MHPERSRLIAQWLRSRGRSPRVRHQRVVDDVFVRDLLADAGPEFLMIDFVHKVCALL